MADNRTDRQRLDDYIKKHAPADIKGMRLYLKRVVAGKEKETRVTPQGVVIVIPIPHQVRFQA